LKVGMTRAFCQHHLIAGRGPTPAACQRSLCSRRCSAASGCLDQQSLEEAITES